MQPGLEALQAQSADSLTSSSAADGYARLRALEPGDPAIASFSEEGRILSGCVGIKSM